jgi:glycosyltransferase involved in cell wall biosynthesis
LRYLVVAPQLGYEPSGKIVPGGLLQFGRCIARAMSSSPSIKKLGIWSQVDSPGVEKLIENTVRTYAHASLDLEIRVFGNSRTKIAREIVIANILKKYDRVMYLLVNQAALGVLPFHIPYDVWEIGEEFFYRISKLKYYALRKANRVLSISFNTTKVAAERNPGLTEAKVVYLCIEPPLYEPEANDDNIAKLPYDPAKRERAVMIVGNIYRDKPYKGHQQLIDCWPIVVNNCSNAQLWIVGDGDGRSILEAQVKTLSKNISKNILFLGNVDSKTLEKLYQRCRVFAMPSTGEGFGLVFIEASRYGVPCIGGKYDSVKEIILHNQTGLLVEQKPEDIADACLKLLVDDIMAKNLGEAGRGRYLKTFRFCHFRERLLNTLGLQI